MVNIGSNKFENVTFPLAFENRYFMLESSSGEDVWSVFTVQDGKPVIEILKNKPQQNDISHAETNPTGIITVSNPETGGFFTSFAQAIKIALSLAALMAKKQR